MKKLLILTMMIITIAFSQNVIDAPVPTWLWQGDTLKGGESLISKPLHTGHFPYFGIYIKTTNPVDSTKYRISFKGAYFKTDTFAISSDTLGVEKNSTIMRISDTLWHYCSVQVPCARYTKIYIDADATDHGDRVCIYIKIFLWYSQYQEKYKLIDE